MKKKMFLGAGNFIFENAKALRGELTHAELILWSYLRERPFGYKFRRQHPISIYIVDFYCHVLKLAIEVDGDIHTDANIQRRDIERQKNLELEGISFIRFTNKDIEKDLENVIKRIEEYIKSASAKD